MVTELYLELPGIDGGSADRDHEGWIEVTSMSWGVQQTSAAGGGGGVGGRAGKATQTPLTVSATTGIASPLLFEAIVKGLHVASARLEAVRASESRDVAARWEMEEVQLSRLDVSGGTELADVFVLTPRRMRLTVFDADPRGGPGQSVTRGWDFGTNQAW